MGERWEFVDAKPLLPELCGILAASMYRPTPERVRARMEAYGADPRVRALAVRDAGRFVGAAVWRETGPKAAELLAIAVLPGERERGVGRALLNELFRRAGLDRLEAETDGEAVGFYRRCGFRAEPLGEKYPGTARTLCRRERNPWEAVPLADYEGHMAQDEVGQLAVLNKLLRAQFTGFPVRTAILFGVAGGNGLEHAAGLERVWGVDVNPAYLAVCRERYGGLGERVVLLEADLGDPSIPLPEADLVVADLLVEYTGADVFARQAAKCRPRYVSCVIQEDGGGEFVSDSPYRRAFEGIGALHRAVGRDTLSAALAGAGFATLWEEEVPLPNGKRFVRMDFSAHAR